MNDSLKFLDMLHNVPWQDGLPNSIVSGTLGVSLHLARVLFQL